MPVAEATSVSSRLFVSGVLELLSAGYNLHCYADGFLRNDFYIYLKTLNYGILFLFLLSLLVICQCTVTNQICSLLAMDKMGLSGQLKR